MHAHQSKRIQHGRIFRTVALAALLLVPAFLHAQNVIQTGSGSYADSVPVAEQTTDSYYGLPANQVSQFYSMLHIDPSITGVPMVTNHWWTDLLVANRSAPPGTGSNQWTIQQDPYGGNMWVIPSMVNPESYGLLLSYANSWKAANGNGSPQGSIDPGTALPVHGDVPYHIPSGDVLIADFESGTYPTGMTRTGSGFASTPSTGSGITGFMGLYCANTRDGGNSATGTLSFAPFTVTKHYLNFLICGGSTSATQVQLVVSGTVVMAAQGLDSTTMRWVNWDISAYNGQQATVQVVDSTGISWGFITVDQIVESDSNQMPGRFGGDMVATSSVVTGWGDWNVDFKLPDAYGNEMDVTMARGIPFTWIRCTGLKPKIILGTATTFYDVNNNVVASGTGTFTTGALSFTYHGKAFGIFLPDNTSCTVGGSGSSLYIEPSLSGSNNYMVIGYLPATTNLSEFNAAAFARPTNTQMSWTLDSQHGQVDTTWTITTSPLKGSGTNTIQGWLPHHYRTTTQNFSFNSYTYQTQRGIMKMATGNSFQISWPFTGIAPALPAPVATGTTNDYQSARMLNYVSHFNPGTMLGETYGSGKALGLCAQNMWMANQLGDTTDFNRLQSALNTALMNWLTYTPAEANGYFASYPDWGALIGFDVSYGSQAFNDLHFHYGYFTIAAGLLGMYNPQFIANYGPMMKLVVKAYANYDRTDQSEPFMRMFDIWEGHSNAGGLSSPNGENQESSSEAMDSWAGIFILGSVMNDSQMQATGAMGFAIEGSAVNEYWEDLYNSNFPAQYNRAWAGQVWGDSFTYANYFTADPLWDYAIQMVPSNHWDTFLIRDQAATAATKWADMWAERDAWAAQYPAWSGTIDYANGTWVNFNSTVYYSGTAIPAGSATPDANNQWIYVADCSSDSPDIMGSYPGDYLLVYRGLYDHDGAAALFDTYYTNNEAIATNNTWAGSTYYIIHALRVLGDPDPNYSTGIPTSAVYLNSKTGVRTFVVYNPFTTTGTAVVYNNGVASGTMTVPGGVVTSSTNMNFTVTAPAAPTGLSGTSGNGQVALTWTAVPQASGYNVKRASVSGGPYTTIAGVASASYVDTTGTAGTTYYYVVSATNSVGESANSSQISATFLIIPPVPTGLAAVSGSGQIAVTWNASAFAASYVVQRSTNGGSTYTTVNSPTTTGYNDTNVTNGHTYYYKVAAVNVTGTSAYCTPVSATYSLPPTAPTGVNGILGNNQVTINWTSVTGATSYNVKRSLVSGGPYTTITSPATNSGTDTGVSSGTTYYYVVSAVNTGGESANSGEVGVNVIPPPLFAVNCGNGGAVGQFAADADFTGGSTGNVGATITTTGLVNPAPQAVYQSYRLSMTNYTIPGFTPGASYVVRLHFAETFWSGTGSRTFNVVINSGTVLTGFDINATAGGKNIATIQQFTLPADSNGQFVVVFQKVKDNPVINGIEIRSVPPSAPTNLTATLSGTSQVVLAWTAPSGTNTYNIKRSTVSGGPYTTIASTAAVSGTDTTATYGTAYYYVVTAVNNGGESVVSNEATVSWLTPIQLWRQTNFGTTSPTDPVGGDAAMPKHDGVPNLVKYALGLDPTKPANQSAMPAIGKSGGYLTLTFTRMQADTDITYHVETSGDLVTWTEIWTSATNPYSGGGASQQVTVSDTTAMSAGKHRYLRLKVTNP